MKDELLAAKERTLLTRISKAAQDFLRVVTGGRREVPDKPGGKSGKGNGRPDFHIMAVKQLPSRVSTFTAMLKKHLQSKTPIEKWEYLFMAMVIQQEASCGLHQISRERLIELLELEKELFQLYRPQYPDVHYVITNLRAYRSVDQDDDVPTALDKETAHTKTYAAGAMIGFDLMARNLLALLEESGTLDDELLLATLSKYDETLFTLTSRIIYQEETGSTASYEDYLATKLSIKETGDWFSLHVTSDQRYFAAVIETMTPPVLVIPVNYRWFSSMTTPKKLQTLDQSDDLMLHLPADIRMFLSKSQADEFRNACQRIYAREDYQSHARILSWLNGTAE
jgi:hypothetical protein